MNITFCINTSKNERYHLELLLNSIRKNFSRIDYPFIIYVENDNQGTVEFLKTQKEIFPNLTVIINPLPIPLGYARNINIMFEYATTDIVSYLQSDMVVGPSYDLEVLKNVDATTIISSTRIEPPLHPPSSEKITCDFGLDPNAFNLDQFNNFVNQNKKNQITDFWFAPFTLYKKIWTDIGGHDTLFRRSREDSDILYRFSIKGISTKQVWNALVYHFTCTSSRGPEWWTEKAKTRSQMQMIADSIEMTKFLKKWPNFKHTSQFDPNLEYKYNISLNLLNSTISDFEILKYYYKFNRIYVSDNNLRQNLREEFDKIDNVANDLLNISKTDWNVYKKYYNTLNSSDIFPDNIITDDDIILEINLNGQSINKFINNPYFSTLNDLIHSLDSDSYGKFEIEELNAILTINKINNIITKNVTVFNPPLDFEFIVI